MDKKTAYRIIQHFVDGSVPQKYLSAVKRWLLSDNNTAEKENALFKIWENTSSEADSHIQESLARFRMNRVKERNAKKHLLSILRYAAVVCLVLASAAGVYLLTSQYYGSKQEMEVCYVPKGEMKKILFSDGTEALINSGSKLSYPKKFAKKRRELSLEGEAYFKVKHDANRPFIVHVKDLNVQVLGTHFNVKAYPEEQAITTTLQSGAVKLYENRKAGIIRYLILRPDEQSVYDCTDRSFSLQKVDAEKVSSWTKGGFDFEEEKLSVILSELERRFNVRFTTDRLLSMRKQYTMNFKPNENLEEILLVLTEISGDMSYKREGNTVHLYQLKRREVSMD